MYVYFLSDDRFSYVFSMQLRDCKLWNLINFIFEQLALRKFQGFVKYSTAFFSFLKAHFSSKYMVNYKKNVYIQLST